MRKRSAKILVKGDLKILRSSPRACHRNPQNGIGPQFRLIGCPIQIDHNGINLHLVQYVQANELWRDLLLHIFHGL